jgi:DNA-binding NarL/FixJ family response regulator
MRRNGDELSPDRRALVADSDADARDEIVRLLASVDCVVEDVPNGETALAAAYGARPNLVVLDVALAGVSAYEVCRSLRQRFGERLPIVLVSEHRLEPADEVAALLLGADDYIAKPIRADLFLARVRRLLARSELPHAGTSSLTPREREVLALLAAGTAPTSIAERLCITEKTTSTHIERILGKLGAHSRVQAVAFAYRDGLVEPDAELVHADRG